MARLKLRHYRVVYLTVLLQEHRQLMQETDLSRCLVEDALDQLQDLSGTLLDFVIHVVSLYADEDDCRRIPVTKAMEAVAKLLPYANNAYVFTKDVLRHLKVLKAKAKTRDPVQASLLPLL